MALFAPQKTTVAQVMGDFLSCVEELNEVAVAQDKEAARQAQIIEDANVAMKVAEEEAFQARELAARLKEAYLPSQSMTLLELRAKCVEPSCECNYA